jgi:hypothetical protein
VQSGLIKLYFLNPPPIVPPLLTLILPLFGASLAQTKHLLHITIVWEIITSPFIDPLFVLHHHPNPKTDVMTEKKLAV